MSRLIYILLSLLLINSCAKKKSETESFPVHSDVRLGNRFYSIYLNEEGRAYVIKGVGSYYTDTLKIKSSDTSEVFRLDSAKIFFENLNKIKLHPKFGVYRIDAPRVEIFFNGQKIYDTFRWDETFWDLFRPIMEQLPKGFNPFRESDKPFIDL